MSSFQRLLTNVFLSGTDRTMPKIKTMEAALALAGQVAKNLSGPPSTKEALVRDRPLSVPPEDSTDMASLYEAVGKVNRRMPDMVDDLLDTFFKRTADGGHATTITERRRIFESLAKFSMTDARLSKAMGLLRDAAKDSGGMVLFQQMNIDVREVRKERGGISRKLAEIIDSSSES